MKEFKVLPTDERFLSLFPEQKEMIFEACNHLPDNELIKSVFYLVRKRQELEEKSESDFVSSRIQIQMRKAFKMTGMSEEKINETIFTQGKARKEQELMEIRKNLNRALGIQDPKDYTERRKALLKERGRLIEENIKKEKDNVKQKK